VGRGLATRSQVPYPLSAFGTSATIIGPSVLDPMKHPDHAVALGCVHHVTSIVHINTDGPTLVDENVNRDG